MRAHRLTKREQAEYSAAAADRLRLQMEQLREVLHRIQRRDGVAARLIMVIEYDQVPDESDIESLVDTAKELGHVTLAEFDRTSLPATFKDMR